MTFSGFMWGYKLEKISPLAKLLAMRFGDMVDPDVGVQVVDPDELMEWASCSYEELLDALIELKEHGIRHTRGQGGKLIVSFAENILRRAAPLSPKSEQQLFIYVIDGGRACKVGISADPDNRLFNLQGGNPSTVLTVRFTHRGPESKIRAAEKNTHARLESKALGREWFLLSADICIAAVKQELGKLGIEV